MTASTTPELSMTTNERNILNSTDRLLKYCFAKVETHKVQAVSYGFAA